jgi:thioredoxin 1
MATATAFDTPLNSNDQSLDRVLRAGLPVALIFADGPTPLDEPLNQLAKQYAGQALIVKIKPGENPVSLRRYPVQGLPALVAIQADKALATVENVTPAELAPHLAYLVGKGPRPAPQAQPRPSAAHANNGSGAHPVIVTDATFEAEVLRASEPVLIDFWAPWCAPCRMVAPVVDKLAGELAGKLRVVKVNTDENPRLSQQFDIHSIPTMMIFKGGRLVTRWAGALPEGGIRQQLRQAVGVG